MEQAATNDELLERAYGVLAERFGIEIETAAAVLAGTARCERWEVHELARAVVSSCCESVALPRRLYDCGADFMSLA